MPRDEHRDPELAARGDVSPTVASHWLHTFWGRWTLRATAAFAFLALGAWYGTKAAQRVATDLTPRPGQLGALDDQVFRNPGGTPIPDSEGVIKRATDAYVSELRRLEAEGQRMKAAERAAAETAARATLAKALEELARTTSRQ